MMLYFFAGGHTNYAHYGLYYLRLMEALPRIVLKHFIQSEHVMRHILVVWNAI